MKKLIWIYAGIGAIFAFIMEVSYLWGAAWILWEAGPISGFIPAAVSLALGIFAGVLRVIDWLPSFIIWAMTENTYSFGRWIAPGFYVSAV